MFSWYISRLSNIKYFVLFYFISYSSCFPDTWNPFRRTSIKGFRFASNPRITGCVGTTERTRWQPGLVPRPGSIETRHISAHQPFPGSRTTRWLRESPFAVLGAASEAASRRAGPAAEAMRHIPAEAEPRLGFLSAAAGRRRRWGRGRAWRRGWASDDAVCAPGATCRARYCVGESSTDF